MKTNRLSIRHRSFGRVFSAVIFASLVHALSAATNADLVHQHLDGLRGVQVPKEDAKIDELNKRMDAAWTFVRGHKSAALPIVEVELRKAVADQAPDQFFLLDMSYLLLSEQGEKAASLAVSALERIDPNADIIQANWVELFHCTMKLGASGREIPRYLGLVDRLFLTTARDIHFFREPHLVKLSPTDVRCFVYGVAGEPAAQHLTELLPNHTAELPQIIQVLSAIGSESNVMGVQSSIKSLRDYENVSACITFMMEVGGPAGRAAVLALEPRDLDERARDHFQKIRPKVEAVTFAALTNVLEQMDNFKAKVSDAKLQRQLDAMEEHDGADNNTAPSAVVKAGIETPKLLAQLKRIRARSFRRETNHVFEDLEVTNTIINALQFKTASR